MVGPVLNQEVLLCNRRGRFHWFRWLYAGWLLLQLAGLALQHWTSSWFRAAMGGISVQRAAVLADFGSDYFQVLVSQHFFLLALATPALVAGAITDEKARGTLQYLLTANLGPGEIVLGKFLGRLFQVLVLALPVLPLACFFGAFGGVEPDLLFTFAASTLVATAGLAAACVLASVWCRHTRDAVLSLYSLAGLVWVIGYLFPMSRVGDLVATLDPWTALQLDATAAERGRHLLRLSLAWSCVIVICLLVAWQRLRPAYSRQLEGAGRKKLRWWSPQRLPLQGDPIRWKERHVEGIAPLATLRRLPRWLGFLLVIGATIYFSGNILLEHLPAGVDASTLWTQLWGGDFNGLLNALSQFQPAGHDFYWQGIAVMCLASLIVGIRCSGAITGEREQRTWEALLLAPLENRQLIHGKFWGILGSCLPYLWVYLAVALPLAILGGLAAAFWTLLWWGVTLVALGYAGAAGLWCSVRSAGSWRSLFFTLILCYVGGFILFLPASLAAAVISLFLLPVLAFLEQVPMLARPLANFQLFQVGICLGLVAAFFLMTLLLLSSAASRLGFVERAVHWTFEPLHRRVRSRHRFPAYPP
jgi:ABC-type transport system involved in multi-copper enzyme maturation permease subunit